MTTQPPTGPRVESFTDPESLRDRDDVPFHEDTDTVDETTLDAISGLDDMAPVGVTNDDGEVLLWRLTDDCAWKLPLAEVAPGEDYAEAARRVVPHWTGLDVELDDTVGVWRHEARLADGERSATRSFVAFAASPATDESVAADRLADGSDERAPAAVGWFESLPDDAEEAPGTGRFFDGE